MMKCRSSKWSVSLGISRVRIPALVGVFYLSSLGDRIHGFDAAGFQLGTCSWNCSNKRLLFNRNPYQLRPSLLSKRQASSQRSFSTTTSINEGELVLPFTESSHRSVTIYVPSNDNEFSSFTQNCAIQSLEATVKACRMLGKSSIWIHVPMKRCAIIEQAAMESLGFHFHHTKKNTVVLNLWLDDSTVSKVPEYASHNVGVGAVVINSRNEILCVQELRKNYMPWKTPTGLSDVGESINEAAVREVLEETGIETVFRRILSFRQTHGMAHDRSDLYFVCQLDPLEQVDESGNTIIAEPTPETSEIAKAEWIPLDEYRAMVSDPETGGHPMMRHVLEVLDNGRGINRKVVQSVVPGRSPNAMYFPN